MLLSVPFNPENPLEGSVGRIGPGESSPTAMAARRRSARRHNGKPAVPDPNRPSYGFLSDQGTHRDKPILSVEAEVACTRVPMAMADPVAQTGKGSCVPTRLGSYS